MTINKAFIYALLVFLTQSNKIFAQQDSLGLNWKIYINETKKVKEYCKGKPYKRQYVSLSFMISTIKKVKFELYRSSFYDDSYKTIRRFIYIFCRLCVTD
jgi:hypothetical protein